MGMRIVFSFRDYNYSLRFALHIAFCRPGSLSIALRLCRLFRVRRGHCARAEVVRARLQGGGGDGPAGRGSRGGGAGGGACCFTLFLGLGFRILLLLGVLSCVEDIEDVFRGRHKN